MILDLIVAHWKVIGTVLTGVLIQVVDSETADWIVLTLGSLFVLLKRNDPVAVARFYSRRR